MKTEEISIQHGCKKVEIDFENNRVIAFYEEKQEFKRGDYISFGEVYNYIAIFEKYANISSPNHKHIACTYSTNNSKALELNGTFHPSHEIKPATTEEIALLDQKLLESGYKFNKETLELEKVEVFNDKDVVLVRDSNKDIWQLRAFKKIVNDIFLCYSTSISGTDWKQCIKYAGNEHLLGTTNKPE